MAEATAFPPQTLDDVISYDDAEIVAGYSEWRAGDPEPGENRSPGYRWGWMNGARDRARDDDGYDWLRQQIGRLIVDGLWSA